MERRLGDARRAYRDGDARRYGKLARGLTLGGAALVGLGGGAAARPRPRAGWRCSAGAAAERWSVFKAGVSSARDPRHTVGPQRARMERRDGGG